MPLTRIFILTKQFVITAKSHEHVGRFALMSILSSTIPIVYIQNTRTVIDYSGKIIHTKKQPGGGVGRGRARCAGNGVFVEEALVFCGRGIGVFVQFRGRVIGVFVVVRAARAPEIEPTEGLRESGRIHRIHPIYPYELWVSLW